MFGAGREYLVDGGHADIALPWESGRVARLEWMDNFRIVLVLVIVLVIVLHDRKMARPTRTCSDLERILGQASAAAIVIELPFQGRM